MKILEVENQSVDLKVDAVSTLAHEKYSEWV
jgi:hypothetical protein